MLSHGAEQHGSMDDGTIIGSTADVKHALQIIADEGPALEVTHQHAQE